MRYLYGDSAPFPHGFDFLSTLDRFLEESARIVRLDSEMRELAETATALESERARAMGELETFHGEVMRNLEQGGMRLGGEYAPEYAGRVLEAAARAMEEARRSQAVRMESSEQALGRELGRRHDDIVRAIDAFFLLARLPILAATIAMQLVEGRAQMSAELVHEGGIVAKLALAAERVPEWQAPRRAGELRPDLEMLIGAPKRGLFRRGDTLEPVRLDDWIVGSFVLREDTAEIGLRRKPNEPDAYVFYARLEDGRLLVDVVRPLEQGEHAEPTALEENDRRKVLSLWERLRSAAESPLDRRERLLELLLDGEDVFGQALYMQLLERLIRSFAHTIAEVARRSPNKEELSLKRESEGGAREELYMKKRDLIAKLSSLTIAEREIFAPLNLVSALE